MIEGAAGVGAQGEGDGAPGQALHLVGGNQLQDLPETVVGGRQAPQLPCADLESFRWGGTEKFWDRNPKDWARTRGMESLHFFRSPVSKTEGGG